MTVPIEFGGSTHRRPPRNSIAICDEGLTDTPSGGSKRMRGMKSSDTPCEVGLSVDTICELEQGLAHGNSADTMAGLVASLAHEITDPIAAAELGAEACLKWIDQDPPALEEVRQALLRIVKDAKRAANIVERNRSHYSERRDISAKRGV